jgi:2-phosphoglycerate kinase
MHEITQDLHHIRWIGGTACSGKTTFARMFAQKYHHHLYQRDEHERDHLRKATLDKQPALHKAWAEREHWETLYRQSPQTIFDQTKAEANEAFEFILEDLLHLPNDTLIVAEGVGLEPELITQVSSPEHALMFVADEELARKTWQDRYMHTPWLNGYSDPKQIVENFIQWTLLSAEHIQEMSRQFDITCLVSSVENPIPEMFRVVERHFGY